MLPGFSPLFLIVSFCCPRRGQFLLKTQRNHMDFTIFDGRDYREIWQLGIGS